MNRVTEVVTSPFVVEYDDTGFYFKLESLKYAYIDFYDIIIYDNPYEETKNRFVITDGYDSRVELIFNSLEEKYATMNYFKNNKKEQTIHTAIMYDGNLPVEVNYRL